MKPAKSTNRPGPGSTSLRKALLGDIALAACVVVSAIVMASAQAQLVRATEGQRQTQPQRTLIAQRVERLRQTSEAFRSIAASPLPRDLSTEQRSEANRYVAWLKTCAGQMDALAASGEGAIGTGGGAASSGSSSMGGNGVVGNAAGGGGQDQLLAATSNMQETQMSFNLQYLQLQNAMQNENRQFTMVSNIMKTKHDTVKNSISNIR